MQLLILHYTVFNSLSNKSAVFSLNDNCCVVSTPILMRCFKKLILQDIQPNIPASPDPHQYAFRTNRSKEDAICSSLSLRKP